MLSICHKFAHQDKGSHLQRDTKRLWQSRSARTWMRVRTWIFFYLAHGTSSPEKNGKVPTIKKIPGPEGLLDHGTSFQVEGGPHTRSRDQRFRSWLFRSWDLRDLPGGGRSHGRSHDRQHTRFWEFWTITSFDLFGLWRFSRWTKNQVLILTTMASGLRLETDKINNIALNVKGYFLWFNYKF